MERLRQYITPDAFHTSDERYEAPKCHPHAGGRSEEDLELGEG